MEEKGGQWATDAFPQAHRDGLLESLEGHCLPVGSPRRQGGGPESWGSRGKQQLSCQRIAEKPLPIEVRAGGEPGRWNGED